MILRPMTQFVQLFLQHKQIEKLKVHKFLDRELTIRGGALVG